MIPKCRLLVADHNSERNSRGGRAVLALLAWACLACSTAHPLPPKAVELNTAGARALAEGDLSRAEACLSVAIEYSPRFVEAWVNLGLVEMRRANFEQARRDLQHARDLNQDIPAPHHALGLLADSEDRGEDAERHYREALKVDPGFAPARANLARRLFARGQFENAREQFQRLVAVQPDEVEGWSGEFEALAALGRFAEAHEVLAAARERLGDKASLVLLSARESLARGDWTEAEAALATVASGSDRARVGSAWAWIAIARLGSGNLKGSRDAARAALAIDSGDAVARYALELAARATRGAIATETTPSRSAWPSR
ncbi:MAG: tetratricopeptide repeat protein [Polyangiaceae bacterium]|jgi:tetratricopeptide (TPR) repeat protein